MFRLAHLSDLHIGPPSNLGWRELASKRIIGVINWRRGRGKRLLKAVTEALVEDLRSRGADHIAITGDLVNVAAQAEFDAVTAWLTGLGDPRDISVVPGNHDAYVREACRTLREAWQPWLAGDNPSARGGDDTFPYLRVRRKVAIVGISTAEATPPFISNGFFRSDQARRVGELLDETGRNRLFRVILIHHPPVRGADTAIKRLVGIRRFAAVLAEAGAELILHGHNHRDTLFHLAGKDGAVPVVGVPAAGASPGGRMPAAGYNIFGIDGEPGSWRCRLHRYGLAGDGGGFGLLHSRFLAIPGTPRQGNGKAT